MKRKPFFAVIQLSLLAAGASLITAGLLNGEAREIIRKAIRICLECIGIG